MYSKMTNWQKQGQQFVPGGWKIMPISCIGNRTILYDNAEHCDCFEKIPSYIPSRFKRMKMVMLFSFKKDL